MVTFKQTMADSRVAREFFETHFPPALLQQIDLKTLKLEKHSFIDNTYKATEADVVYSVKHGKTKAYFYLLCENQHDVDPYMAFRLLVYKVRLMELHHTQYPKSRLPLVYSMVVYTGNSVWNAPFDIVELMEEPVTFARQLFWQPYQLIALNQIEDEVLRQRIWSGLVEFTLKYREMRDLEKFLEILLPWLEALALQAGEQVAKTVLYYVADGIEFKDQELFLKKADQHLSSKLKGETMTMGEYYRQKGEAELLLRQLRLKFKQVPETIDARVKNATTEQLFNWGAAVLFAANINEVFV
jgi:predicted transposase YdaD